MYNMQATILHHIEPHLAYKISIVIVKRHSQQYCWPADTVRMNFGKQYGVEFYKGALIRVCFPFVFSLRSLSIPFVLPKRSGNAFPVRLLLSGTVRVQGLQKVLYSNLLHTWAVTFSSWSFFALSSSCRAMDTSSEFLFFSFFIFSSARKVAFKLPLLEASFWRKKWNNFKPHYQNDLESAMIS